METRTINVYKFAELSNEAKERAVQEDQANGDWSRADEYLESIKALAAHFGGRVVDYSLDWSNGCGPSSMKFDMPEEMDEAEIRRRLRALGSYNKRTLKGDGDCKLTGMCYDENAIDGFRMAFIRGKERGLNALMEAAYETWIAAAWADYEYDYDPEKGYAETAEANDWRYYESGEFYGDRKASRIDPS